MKEYQMMKVPDIPVIKDEGEFDVYTKQVCSSFDKLHQHFVEHYLSNRSPYKSVLLYHSLGVGKTCSAITVAEAMLTGHVTSEGPRVIVISSKTLQDSFKAQINGQCTDGYYAKLARNDPKRIDKLINSRYRFMTDNGIIGYAKECKGVMKNMTLIIDEAHNLRVNESAKESSFALEKLIRENANSGNRLVMLSATPMYDKPKEIVWLLSLLLQNDGHKPLVEMDIFDKDDRLTENGRRVLRQVSNEYISFIKSMNPFAFAQRFSPVLSGVDTISDSWAKKLKEWIVPSEPGNYQMVAPEAFQAANITFPNTSKTKSKTKVKPENNDSDAEEIEVVGDKDGFKRVFVESGGGEKSLRLQYVTGYENALMPTPDNLGSIAAKLQLICELIHNSKGIVLVYSRYIYSGVLPLAIALEHMGMQRYGVENSLLRNPKVTETKLKSKYCIMCGSKDVMGSSSISKLIVDMNSAKNVDGKVVKVALITEIAEEGLSFHNVREVHILEPWYHINRTEQVIGRAIRTCSHTELPLANRNVTVYLHALYHRWSPDIRMYRDFVAKKFDQIQEIEDIIRVNAVDCEIMKNMNFYRPSSFPFTMTMETSQGALVPVKLGDKGPEPMCNMSLSLINDDTFHIDTYGHIIPLAMQRISNILKVPGTRWVSLEQIKQKTKLDPAIIDAAIPYILHPNKLVPGYRIYPHSFRTFGLLVQPDTPQSMPYARVKLPTVKQDDVEMKSKQGQVASKVASIKLDDPNVAVFMMYTTINSEQWDEFAQHVIVSGSKLAAMVRQHGPFVFADEMQRGSKTEAIGYVNIFDISDFRVMLRETGTSTFRQATVDEVRTIMARRTKAWDQLAVQNNNKHEIGLIVPETKRGAHVAVNTFKIVNTVKGKKTGRECKSQDMPVLINLRDELKIAGADKKPRESLCILIGFELFRRGRVLCYPQFKPA
jgi:hypothetical protein